MPRKRSGILLLVLSLLCAAFVLPVQGDTVFRHAYGDSLGTLDPVVTHTHMDWEIMLQVYEGLVGYSKGSLTELESVLATKVPTLENGLVSEDGLTYTFPLRRGVKFHDGTDFTAEDVAYSFQRGLQMNIAQAKFQEYVSPYIDASGIEVVDEYTVRLHIKEAFPGFIFSLCDPSASIVSKDYVEAHGGIIPGEENEWMQWHMAGTGPFKLEEAVPPGQRIVLVRNEDYWGEKPALDRIETVLVLEPSTQILMLKNGEVDSIEIEQDQLRNVENTPGIAIQMGAPALRSHTIKFQLNINTDKMDSANTIPSDFFQDVNVRKAFAYAFPYEDYLRVYRPNDLAYNGPIPNGMFGDYPDGPRYRYDPEKAAEYFKKTEWWEKGFTITMYTLPQWGTWPEAIMLLSESLKKINPKFDLQTRAVEWATLVDMADEGSIPIRVGAIRGVSADPDSIVRRRMYEGGWDTMGMDDPLINHIIEEASYTQSKNQREALYHALELIAYDTACMLFISQDTGFLVYRDRIKGLHWHPIFQHWMSWRDITIEE